MVLWKTLWVFGLFSGDKRYCIDMSMIKLTAKSNQMNMDVKVNDIQSHICPKSPAFFQ